MVQAFLKPLKSAQNIAFPLLGLLKNNFIKAQKSPKLTKKAVFVPEPH